MIMMKFRGREKMARGFLLSDRIKKRVKKFREIGLTQKEIAEILNISQNSVSRILNKKK